MIHLKRLKNSVLKKEDKIEHIFKKDFDESGITTRVVFKGEIWKFVGKTANELKQIMNSNSQAIVKIYNRYNNVKDISVGELKIISPIANGEKYYNK